MNFQEKSAYVRRIECWIATLLYLLCIFVLLSEAGEQPVVEYPDARVIIPFSSPLIREIVQYSTLYGVFMFFTLKVVPDLLDRKRVWVNLLLTLVSTLLIGIVFGELKFGIGPVSVFAAYSVFKYGLIFLWSKSGIIHQRIGYLAPGVLLIIVLWLISIVFFLAGEADSAIIAVWVTLIPFGLLLYSYSFFSLIPMTLTKRQPFLCYVGNVILLLFIASFPVGVICILITGDSEVSLSIVLTNNLFQLFITLPFSWILFKRHAQETEEINTLHKELGQSTANFDFLRSQINPHFLFNALNTVYGTALLEKAERTGEAIQKLGDMMRFMLHENLQPKILLAREIEYLHNYIDLQRLRTDSLPEVRIDTRIEAETTTEQISPMLLIPFVENAFKHGVSFRESSFIRIALNLTGPVLHFDVSNSRHERSGTDPEKDKSGIGLDNVKQRLQLLYPEKHELIIRETGKEFFVHLTIQLS